ncbi:hypothetical protein JW921_00495 [Candidatus Fermentibacterales bacterium]|nr:hypothetical protein [Candidatus Fermentibacterales bacterium]
MGTRGREIVGGKADELIALLNKALADEWLAYYQYWVGSKVVMGPMKEAAITELLEHAADELRHAEMVCSRIIQLGGTPVLSPKAWYEHTNCGYDSPEDPYIESILKQNIKGEQCAIEVYNKLALLSRESDIITHNMVLQILSDEVEHEDDLQSLLEDYEVMLQRRG